MISFIYFLTLLVWAEEPKTDDPDDSEEKQESEEETEETEEKDTSEEVIPEEKEEAEDLPEESEEAEESSAEDVENPEESWNNSSEEVPPEEAEESKTEETEELEYYEELEKIEEFEDFEGIEFLKKYKITEGEDLNENASEGIILEQEDLKKNSPEEEPPKELEKKVETAEPPLLVVPAFQWQSETAWQVPRGNKYIGTWRLGYAPLKRFSVTTTMFPWIVKGVNANFRVPIYQKGKWLVGTEFGFLRWDLVDFVNTFPIENLEEQLPVEMVVYINPIYFNVTRKLGERVIVGASLRHHQFTLGSGITGAQEGNAELNLNIGTTNTHLRGQFAFALSDHWSIWVIRNRLLKQDILAETYNVVSLDSGGKLEVFLDSSTSIANFENATATGFRLYYHGRTAEMMFGFDIGQEPLYMIGSVLPEIPVPEGTPIGIPFLPYASLGWNF